MKTRPDPFPSIGDAERDYLFDMIRQLALMARRTGETVVAIHLDAIIATQEVMKEDHRKR